MKKVALIGTHGIGKTTIAHELVASLKKAGKNAEFLGEVVRDCPFPINEDTSKEAQLWVIHSQYIKELEMTNRCDYLVCDRSVLDGYIYYLLKFDRLPEIELWIINELKKYYKIFKVPLTERYLVDDGIRSTNREFQFRVEEKLIEMLKEFGVEVFEFESVEKALIEIVNGQ